MDEEGVRKARDLIVELQMKNDQLTSREGVLQATIDACEKEIWNISLLIAENRGEIMDVIKRAKGE